MTLKHYKITRADARKTVAEFLHRHLKKHWNEARQMVREGKVRLDEQPVRDSAKRLKLGQQLSVDLSPLTEESRSRFGKKPAPPPPPPPKVEPRNTSIRLLFVDGDVVVVDKPSGLTTMRHSHEEAEFGKRAKKFLPTTLEDQLPALLPLEKGKKPRVIAVHRLDKETSGLLVFARNPEAARHLGKQMRAHSAERGYLAVVRGEAKDARIESVLVRDRGDGRRGSGEGEDGQQAITHVRVVEKLGNYTLVECRLETGRTHQVRIHLGEAGTPICGERLYDRPTNGRPVPDNSGAERVALHAATLEFEHPVIGQKMQFSSRMPHDMKQLLNRLRRIVSRQKTQEESGETVSAHHQDDADLEAPQHEQRQSEVENLRAEEDGEMQEDADDGSRDA